MGAHRKEEELESRDIMTGQPSEHFSFGSENQEVKKKREGGLLKKNRDRGQKNPG